MGATSPLAMSRNVASPDADTPSYAPVAIWSTMSSEPAPSFVITWQPVCFVKSSAQDLSA
jgi:hypothetical protein